VAFPRPYVSISECRNRGQNPNSSPAFPREPGKRPGPIFTPAKVVTVSTESQHADRVRSQFGATAAGYVSSPTHASGQDLEILVGWAEGGPTKRLLDVATGGGHTALALARAYGEVMATDLTEPMLDAAREFIASRGARNVEFAIADAQELPFPDGSFDAVSCRIAPHHFLYVDRFVVEVARVLKPGGILLLEDSIVPDDPDLATVLNHVERARDPTHVRSLTRQEWLATISGAGLVVEEQSIDRKRHELPDRLDRAQTPREQRQEVERVFRASGARGRETFKLEFTCSGDVIAFSDEKILVKARKPAHS
jgi:SAM-dependent methyltransferase